MNPPTNFDLFFSVVYIVYRPTRLTEMRLCPVSSQTFAQSSSVFSLSKPVGNSPFGRTVILTWGCKDARSNSTEVLGLVVQLQVGLGILDLWTDPTVRHAYHADHPRGCRIGSCLHRLAWFSTPWGIRW